MNALDIILGPVRVVEEVALYDFELRVGTDGPVVFQRTYADKYDMEDSHNAGYRMIFNGVADNEAHAWTMFQRDVAVRLTGLFTDRRY